MLNSLTKQKDFDYVFKSGKASYDNIIGIKVLDNKLNKNRFGVIVGTKISKKATERNKIKRQIREIIYSDKNLIKSGIDCIIITLQPIVNTDFNNIKKSINSHFKKLRLYKNDK